MDGKRETAYLRSKTFCLKGHLDNQIKWIKSDFKALILFTSDYIHEFFAQMDYVAFTCPEGYVFEGSNNITHYAFCFNTTFVHEYDPAARCVRKYYRYD